MASGGPPRVGDAERSDRDAHEAPLGYRVALALALALLGGSLMIGLAYRVQRERHLPSAHLDFLREADELLALGDFDEAARLYAVAAGIPQLDGRAAYQLAVALDQVGDVAGVAAALRQSLRLEPDDLEARAFLGLALVRLGRSEEAIGELSLVLGADPLNARALAALGSALLGANRTEEAAAYFERALSIDPSNSEARERLVALGRLPRESRP